MVLPARKWIGVGIAESPSSGLDSSSRPDGRAYLKVRGRVISQLCLYRVPNPGRNRGTDLGIQHGDWVGDCAQGRDVFLQEKIARIRIKGHTDHVGVIHPSHRRIVGDDHLGVRPLRIPHGNVHVSLDRVSAADVDGGFAPQKHTKGGASRTLGLPQACLGNDVMVVPAIRGNRERNSSRGGIRRAVKSLDSSLDRSHEVIIVGIEELQTLPTVGVGKGIGHLLPRKQRG